MQLSVHGNTGPFQALWEGREAGLVGTSVCPYQQQILPLTSVRNNKYFVPRTRCWEALSEENDIAQVQMSRMSTAVAMAKSTWTWELL